MAELIVVGFKKDMHRASEVLNTLQELESSWVVDLQDSAIFALLRRIDPEPVAERFKGYGGTILRTTLNADQRAKVEATLHADDTDRKDVAHAD